MASEVRLAVEAPAMKHPVGSTPAAPCHGNMTTTLWFGQRTVMR
jgi:hypothetical protein